MSLLVAHAGDKHFKIKNMIEKKVLSADERLRVLYLERLRLYRKGCNDEKLNEKIRVLQFETDYKVKE